MHISFWVIQSVCLYACIERNSHYAKAFEGFHFDQKPPSRVEKYAHVERMTFFYLFSTNSLCFAIFPKSPFWLSIRYVHISSAVASRRLMISVPFAAPFSLACFAEPFRSNSWLGDRFGMGFAKIGLVGRLTTNCNLHISS